MVNSKIEKRRESRRRYYSSHREEEIKKKRSYYRAFEPYKGRLYTNIRQRLRNSSSYKNRKLFFSRDEFLAFVEENIEVYKSLHEGWRKSGFQTKFAPSVDRVNNDGDYALDNIELVPMHENIRRAHQYRREKGYVKPKKQAEHPRMRKTFGITFHKKSGKWQAQMWNKYIGIFPTQEEARSAINKYLLSTQIL